MEHFLLNPIRRDSILIELVLNSRCFFQKKKGLLTSRIGKSGINNCAVEIRWLSRYTRGKKSQQTLRRNYSKHFTNYEEELSLAYSNQLNCVKYKAFTCVQRELRRLHGDSGKCEFHSSTKLSGIYCITFVRHSRNMI